MAHPQFDVNFTENHTSYGLTFYFVGDYPLEMFIRWYDISGICISEKRYEITGNIFFVQNQVEDYAKLNIQFTKAKPHRYVKFRFIEYGTDLLIGHEGLPAEGASLTEEADPISDKIPINKLKFKLIDEDDKFNIGNVNGLHKALQSGQECMAYEYVDDSKGLLGKFFLDSHSAEKNVTTMSFIDLKGLLDNSRYLKGKVYSGEPAGDVIDDIMAAAGIADYRVSDEVRAVPLYGWLKNNTCRKALREVLFACGAVADSSRRDYIDIYIPDRLVKTFVERTRKFSTQTSNEDYISDVTVKYPVYALQDKTSEVVKGTYAAGTYTVELSSPAADMSINSGLILEQGNNYVTFKVGSETDVVITGTKYDKEDLSVTASEVHTSAGQSRNTKTYTGTVLNGTQAAAIAEKILEYYQLRLKLKIKFLNEGDKPVDWSEIENNVIGYESFVAGFEKVTTDLTGGFISTATMRGYYKLLGDYYYATELFTDEEVGIL